MLKFDSIDRSSLFPEVIKDNYDSKFILLFLSQYFKHKSGTETGFSKLECT